MTSEPLTSSPQVSIPESTPRSAPRFDAVDIVKGIAIMLVVFGHTLQGLQHREWWSTPVSFSLRSVIYSFHMPVFFLVSGFFVVGSLRKRGAKAFVIEKTSTILYPYVIWTFIGIGFSRVLGGNELGHKETIHETLVGLVTGNSNWFLYTLYCVSLLAVVFVRMPAWLRVAAGLLIAVSLPATGLVLTDRLPGELPFFLIGMWLGKESLVFMQGVPKYLSLLGALILFTYQALSAAHLEGENQATFLLLGLTGSMALFLCAGFLGTSFFGRAFAWIGRASLGVFLMHAFAQGGTREFLARVFHTHNAAVHLVVTTLVATLVPALVWSLKERLHYAWLFSWPGKKRVASPAV